MAWLTSSFNLTIASKEGTPGGGGGGGSRVSRSVTAPPRRERMT